MHVGNVKRFAGLKTITRYTLRRRKPDLFLSHAKGNSCIKFIVCRIMEKQTETFRIQHVGSFLCNVQEYFVDLEIETDYLSKFEQGMQLSVALAKRLTVNGIRTLRRRAFGGMFHKPTLLSFIYSMHCPLSSRSLPLSGLYYYLIVILLFIAIILSREQMFHVYQNHLRNAGFFLVPERSLVILR